MSTFINGHMLQAIVAEQAQQIEAHAATIASQAAQIKALRADLRDWAECASIDVTMEGPRLMGWNPIALNRCLNKYEAALQPKENNP